MKYYWTSINNPKGSIFDKKTPTDTDNMVIMKIIEWILCTVTNVKRKREKLINIEMCIKTLEGIIAYDNNKEGGNNNNYII